MLSSNKRLLSLLLAMVMIFSMVPVQAFAEEHDGHDHSSEDSAATQQNEQSAVAESKAQELAERINAILAVYDITADMTDDQIGKAILSVEWSVNKPNIQEIAQIEALAEEISADDARLSGYEVLKSTHYGKKTFVNILFFKGTEE